MKNCLSIRAAIIASLLCLFSLVIQLHAQIKLPPLVESAISGVVVGSDGSSFAAVVTAGRTATPPARGRVVTGPNGTFTITGLTAGTYMLCAYAKAGGYLDPCVWNRDAPTVDVGANQTVTGQRIVLAKGSPLQVRLNDATQTLATAEAHGVTPGVVSPHVMLVVIAERHIWVPLSIIGQDGSGRDLKVAIPFDKDVRLLMLGSGVQVKDASGAAVNLAGTTVTVNHPAALAAQVPQVLTYQVTAQ